MICKPQEGNPPRVPFSVPLQKPDLRPQAARLRRANGRSPFRRCAAPPGLRPSPQGKSAKAAGYGPQGKPSCGRFRRPPAAGSGFAGAPCGPPSADKARGMGLPPLASPTQKAGSPLQDCRPSAVSYQNAIFINSATQHRMMASGTYTYRPMPYHSAPRRFLLPVLTAASSASFFIT